MRELLKQEVLEALKEILQDLEGLRFVPDYHSEVALLGEDLRITIAKIENESAPEAFEIAA
jgi:hypothetical protein